jgi:hypothetical protein
MQSIFCRNFACGATDGEALVDLLLAFFSLFFVPMFMRWVTLGRIHRDIHHGVVKLQPKKRVEGFKQGSLATITWCICGQNIWNPCIRTRSSITVLWQEELLIPEECHLGRFNPGQRAVDSKAPTSWHGRLQLQLEIQKLGFFPSNFNNTQVRDDCVLEVNYGCSSLEHVKTAVPDDHRRENVLPVAPAFDRAAAHH